MRIHNLTGYSTRKLRRLFNSIMRDFAIDEWKADSKGRYNLLVVYKKRETSPIGDSSTRWHEPHGRELGVIQLMMPSVGCKTRSLISGFYWFASRGTVWFGYDTPLPAWAGKLQDNQGYMLWSDPRLTRRITKQARHLLSLLSK
jgi:hypothetical protein